MLAVCPAVKYSRGLEFQVVRSDGGMESSTDPICCRRGATSNKLLHWWQNKRHWFNSLMKPGACKRFGMRARGMDIAKSIQTWDKLSRNAISFTSKSENSMLPVFSEGAGAVLQAWPPLSDISFGVPPSTMVLLSSSWLLLRVALFLFAFVLFAFVLTEVLLSVTSPCVGLLMTAVYSYNSNLLMDAALEEARFNSFIVCWRSGKGWKGKDFCKNLRRCSTSSAEASTCNVPKRYSLWSEWIPSIQFCHQTTSFVAVEKTTLFLRYNASVTKISAIHPASRRVASMTLWFFCGEDGSFKSSKHSGSCIAIW